MARRRRKFKISGDEYTFGGGASSDSVSVGTLKIARGTIDTTSANHGGFISNGAEFTIKLDAGTSIPAKDQYVYFDNAFETNTGTITLEYLDGDTALATGLTWQTDADSTNTDVGYGRIYGTPSTEGTNRYKIKYDNSRGDKAEVIMSIKRFPVGTTPVWSTSVHSIDRIIRNIADPQVIAQGPTTTYSGATYSIKDISGFATGVTPTIDALTGVVSVSNVGDITQNASAHQYTVVADLGSEIGTFEQTFTGNIGYGDPYGARYWGPANARTNVTSNSGPHDDTASETYHNFAKSSGALRRYQNNRYDTSPYLANDGFGCEWTNQMSSRLSNTYADNITTAYRKNGVMGPMGSGNNNWSSSSNFQTIRYTWTVPAGVTRIAIVCAGAGGPGMYSWSQEGGGGGALCWINGVTVTPGSVLEIGVGLGRAHQSSSSSYGSGPSWVGVQGGDTILAAQGGGYTGYTNQSINGQTFNGYTMSGIDVWNKGAGYNYNNNRDGGGWGINSSFGDTVNGFHYGGGIGSRSSGSREGGGAGGYRGGTTQWEGHNNNGQFGGGGQGYYYSSTHGEGGGGGVGLDGQGWQGSQTTAAPRSSTQAGSGYGGAQTNWTSYSQGSPHYYGAGGGGSGGSRANYGQTQYANYEFNGHGTRCGGLHGGGGGGSGTSNGGGHGAPGGVRIIWGVGEDGVTERSFPYTYCSEKPSMQYNGEA